MDPEDLFALVFIFGMFNGVFIVYLGLKQRSHQLEMQHRERMAMIERGQIPLSEPLPGVRAVAAGAGAASSRALSIGIIIVGVGLAMMTVISIAGESPETGIGVGGAITILGAAFIVRSFMVPPATPPEPRLPTAPPPSEPRL